MTDPAAAGAVPAAARRAAGAWRATAPRIAPLGRGHINDTWLVQWEDGLFVLQRLSGAVFPQPDEVAAKVARVVAHLAADERVHVPELVALPGGRRWHRDEAGAVWRLWVFAEGTRTLDTLSNAAQGEAAGAAFGTFQLAIADLQGPVADPVEGFLRLPAYLEALDAAVAEHPPDAEAAAALDRVEPRRDLANSFTECDRLIHGDCKIDNLLFHHRRDTVVGIIDLDTVMRGHWAWDFGDLARSAAADGTSFEVRRFTAIARGFVRSGAVGAGPEVREQLVLAPQHLALMLGVRFLTDHLRGDRYFKVARSGENLSRALRQLDLLEDMERRERAMCEAARKL